MEIENIKYTGRNVIDVYNFLTGENAKSHSEVKTSGEYFYIDFSHVNTCSNGKLIVKTVVGEKEAEVGDIIAKNEVGFYVVKEKEDYSHVYPN